MTIIANHAHLMPDDAWMPGGVDLLLQHLDDNEIDRAVVFPPFAIQVDFSMRRANEWALNQVRQHADRLLPAATIYPLAPDAVEMLRWLADEGVRLVKIHPAIDRHDVADPAARPFYARAQELGMVLDYHTGAHGVRLSMTRPEKFDDIAWDFPGLKLVFEHLGGRAYFNEFLAILCNHRQTGDQGAQRVFGGLTSVLSEETNGLWHLGQERIEEVVRCAGADQLIFGLDFPYNSSKSIGADIARIKSLRIAETDKTRILGGNLAQLLDLDAE